MQLKGNYILSNEHIGARMQAIGRSALLGKPLMTPEEIIKKIEAVDCGSVSDIIDRVLDVSTLSIAAAGPIDGIEGMFVF